MELEEDWETGILQETIEEIVIHFYEGYQDENNEKSCQISLKRGKC